MHFKNGNQVLRCNGETNQYDDPDAGVPNARPVPCEEVKGCEEIKQDLQKADVKVIECLKSGNVLAAGCTLEVRCLKGTTKRAYPIVHPDNIRVLSEGCALSVSRIPAAQV